MEIIETNLKFANSMTNRSATRRIILHNADAVTCTAEQIHAWHLANGWAGAGYHFLVRKDGKIYRLRPENKVGSHASGANADSIGICFEGAFNRETMGQTQINAGIELVNWLKTKYGISKVQPHKEVTPTDCPGKNFPFDQIANGKSENTYQGWVHEGNRWWWRWADGSFPKSEWQERDGEWYWFDPDGYAAQGWRELKSKDGSTNWYYFRTQNDAKQCAMVKNTVVQIGASFFAFDKNGHMKTSVDVAENGALIL